MTYQQIRYIRKILDITQEEIQEKTGITQFTLSKIERGKLKVRQETVDKLLIVFKEKREVEIERYNQEIDRLKNLF